MDLFGKRRKPEDAPAEVLDDESQETSEPADWTEFEAWLFRVVTGVHHTDPANGSDAVFDMFLIQFNEESVIIVTPDTAAAEMEGLKTHFSGRFQHIFDAAIPG